MLTHATESLKAVVLTHELPIPASSLQATDAAPQALVCQPAQQDEVPHRGVSWLRQLPSVPISFSLRKSNEEYFVAGSPPRHTP